MFDVSNFDWPSFALGLILATSVFFGITGLFSRLWANLIYDQAKEDAERRLAEVKKPWKRE